MLKTPNMFELAFYFVHSSISDSDMTIEDVLFENWEGVSIFKSSQNKI